jgi:hypothetical protein
MTIRVDPEENETGALFDFVNLAGARVLEIGSGDCRLTWGYADRVEHVTAVEPFAPAITRARQQLPRKLEGRVCSARLRSRSSRRRPPGWPSMSQSFPGLCCIEQDRMVPALDEAHRLLGPSGPLIDIHPVFGTAQVEVHRTGKVVFAEAVPADEGVLHADEALDHVTARGLFVSERHKEFDFRVYGSSGDELRDFLAEADAHSSQACEEACDGFESELFARVERVMAGQAGAAEVAYHERAPITRVRPVIM